MKPILPVLALLALAGGAVSADPIVPRADAWWNDIRVLADNKFEGRLTGSPGYRGAADYVVSRFKALGLKPAGENGGYEQRVDFEVQRVDQAASKAELVGKDGSARILVVGEDMLISAGGARRPEHVDAPLVFAGYGLHLPEQGWDDFKGLDVKGKIVVVISGGPDTLPGPVKSTFRADRAKYLGEAGAVGLIALTTPKQVEIPWARGKLLALQPGMYLADKTLRETPDNFFQASVDPERSQALFEGSGHSFADLSALADASKPVPSFDLAARLRATTAAKYETVSSPNLIARLDGSDPKLKHEFVALSAHLDHLGVGAPINGDPVYHGAMDDASGVASVLDMAGRLKAGPRPKRSMLFVIVTAEEKGLLGSHYFARRPTVPKGSVVADLNLDMPLPLWTLKSVTVQGEAESTLGADARVVASRQGLELAPDPLPERNSFIRTDQFSFVKAGTPALAFKFGFAKGTPQFDIEHAWRANRYHSPMDNIDQPGVLKDQAIRLDDFVTGIALRVADAPGRPHWLETSVFKRYATNR
jgi:Zn-dependent M28 family amino/carboxypeptidase